MNCTASPLITAAYAAGYGQLSVRNLKEVLVAAACKRSGSSCDLTTLLNKIYNSAISQMSQRDILEGDVSSGCAGVGGGGQCSSSSLETTNLTNGYAKISTGELVKALIAASCS